MKYTTCLLKRYGKGLFVYVAAAVGAAVMLGSTCSVLNKAPTVPVITGPSAGVVGVPVTFKATAMDPESDSIAFQFDWGDSSIGVWTNLIASGETTSVAHTYTDSGAFSIKVKAKDQKGKESALSAPTNCQVGIVQFSWPDSLIGEIAVHARPGDRCLVTPDGRYMYVTFMDEDYVTPIRLTDRAVLPAVAVGPGPYCLAVTPDARYLYVTCVGDSAVAVVRTSDNTVVTRILLHALPVGVTVSPDGQRAYVAEASRRMLGVIRTQDNTIEDTIVLPQKPYNIAMSPDGQTAYVTLPESNLLGIVSIPQRSLVDTITLGGYPDQLELSSDGMTLYVSNQADSGVAVVRTSDRSVVAHIHLADMAVGDLVVAPSGDYLLASYWGGIKSIALPACVVVDSAPHGERGALAFSSDGESLYVGDYDKVLVLGKRR